MKFNGKSETFELHPITCRNMIAKLATDESEINIEYGGERAHINNFNKKCENVENPYVISISSIDKEKMLQYIRDNVKHFEKILSNNIPDQRKYIMAAINQTLLRDLPGPVTSSITPKVIMMLIQNANYNNFVTEVQAEWMIEMAQ